MDTYKGKYKVVQISTNKAAVKFWMKFYEKQGIKYIETKKQEDDLEINVQIFNV